MRDRGGERSAGPARPPGGINRLVRWAHRLLLGGLLALALPALAQAPSVSPTVDVRAGDHGSYVRLVFDWPGPVGYAVDKQGGRAVISFTKPAKLDLAALQASLPADLGVGGVESGAKGLSLTLQVPLAARLRHFTSDHKVVIDVVRAKDADAPKDSDKVPLAPPPGGDIAVPALRPPAPEARPKTVEESLKAGPSPVKPIPEPKAKSKPDAMTALTAPLAPNAAPEPAKDAKPPPPPPPPPPAKIFSLSLAMTKPAAAAVFQRAGYLWIVLDRRAEMDTTLLRRMGGEAVLSAEQLPNKDATVVRLVVRPDYSPSVRKEGLLWVVDLTDQGPRRPKDLIPVVAPANLPSGIGMSLKAPDSGGLISLLDPEVGDVIKVVPVIPVSQGVYPGRDTPDVELLATSQGIAVIPHVDGLDIRSTRGGVTIGTTSGAGLRFSSDADTAPKDAAGAGKGLFDIGAWKQGGAENFATNSKIVAERLAGASASRRALANLQAARFYFANGFGAETLGFLRLAIADQPDLADQPGVKALRGAAEFLMAQSDIAFANLDSPELQSDAEAQMWRAAAHAADEDQPAAWDKPLAAGLPLLRSYPHYLKWKILTAAVKAAVAAGDDQGASQALTLMDREEVTPSEQPQRDYLHGLYDQMAGHFEKAIDEFDNAGDGDNRQYRALARFAETELSLRTRKIKPKEAAEQLDKLRFSWREQSFEFALLLRYAELQREAEDYPSALRALRSLVNYYPDDKSTPKAVQMMQDIFNMLYLQGGADSMPPVSAIGLFDEFRDLTPTGAEGDEMIRKLADRLVKVDLLDRAADLLKHQVTYRLSGVDKARVGAQLALIDLLNQQPQAALEGLVQSEIDAIPDDLKTQRRHLRARALSDLDRPADAVQALAGDSSPEAAQLRAEIHVKAKDWPAAAADYEAMLPRPDRGVTYDDSAARTCLGWATALVLGNDERGLANLRRNYGPAMAGTPYREGFTLLTSALDRDTPNLPEVISKIKEVESFKSFLTDYRKRLQDSGVSGIN